MDELIRRVDVARPLLEKYREVKRQAERARNLRNLGSCLAFRSDMETLRACIQIAVEAPAMGEAGGMIQEAAVRRPVLQDRIEKERWADADEGRTAGDRAAAAGGDGPAVRRPPGEGGCGAAGPVQGESEAGT